MSKACSWWANAANAAVALSPRWLAKDGAAPGGYPARICYPRPHPAPPGRPVHPPEQGQDKVTLTTLGAKSGQPRRVPLIAIPLEDDEQQTGPEARGKIILVASNFGRVEHPAWYYNLRANPLALLSVNGYSGQYVAYEAVGNEREVCWQQAAFLYGGYNAYRQRASHRSIGVFVLTLAVTNPV